MLAVRSGDDALAKEALLRKGDHDKQQLEFGKQWGLQKDAVEKLKEQLRTLNDKIEEAKRKKNILIARQKRAEAQKAIQDTMRGLSDNSAFDTFERMTQKVDQIEAESEASAELGGELAGDTLQQKFKKLESAPGGEADGRGGVRRRAARPQGHGPGPGRGDGGAPGVGIDARPDRPGRVRERRADHARGRVLRAPHRPARGRPARAPRPDGQPTLRL